MIPARIRAPLLILMLVTYVLVQSYAGRSDIRKNNLAGCQRGKLDRADNAHGWRTSQQHADGLGPAATYSMIAARLEKRARVDCARAFPKPALVPFL